MRATGGAMLHPALAPVLAAIGARGLPLGGGDVAVAVGVHQGEPGFGPGASFGDHHRTTVAHPAGAGVAAMGASVAPMLAASLELGLADNAVIVCVEAFEAGVSPLGPAGLGDGAHLFTGDRAVAIGVGGGEALDAGVDELGPAEALVAVGVGAQGPGLSPVRGLLGEGDAASGEGQGDQSARQNGFSHFDVSMAARCGRTSLSGE